MAYFSFPKYPLPVGSGPDVMVVAEERGALRWSHLLPCRGFDSSFGFSFSVQHWDFGELHCSGQGT